MTRATMGTGFLGVEHRPFNWRLREARLARGWTRGELGRQSGVGAQVGAYEALKVWPAPSTAQRIACALGDDPAYLFPAEAELVFRGRVARSVVSVLPMEALTLGAPEVVGLLSDGGLEAVEDDPNQRRQTLDQLMSTLTDRERRVLQLLFGLEDGRARTLQEVGKELDVTRERIRRIEAHARRKLRHRFARRGIDCSYLV